MDYSPWGVKESDTTGVKHSASFGLPLDFPYGSPGKESAHDVGDLGLVPGLGTSPGKGKGYPLQDSVLENSIDCIVHGEAELDTTE